VLFGHQTIGVTSQGAGRFSVKHREHKGVGYDQGYSTASLFLSPRRGGLGLSFIDARLHVFNNMDLASNVGIGSRFSDRQQTYLFGMNAYYDYRNSYLMTTHQLSGGCEILSPRMDIRVNGYYPFIGTYYDEDIAFSEFRKHAAYVKQKVHYALPCVDAEAGFTLPDPFDQIGLYLSLGYYYLFKQQGFNKSAGHVSGGRVRMTASPSDYMSLGVEYTYDALFGSRANGFLALNIPLGSTRSYKQVTEKHQIPWIQIKTQDVIRNEIIPIVKKQHCFVHLNGEGKPLHFVFVNNKKGGDAKAEEGTFEHPYTTLGLAQEHSSEGDIIYVFPGDGSSKGYDKGFVLKREQILTSAGVDFYLNGVVFPALRKGHLPFITAEKGSVIQAFQAGQVEVNGFKIEAVSGHAVESEGSTLTLTNNWILAAPKYHALAVKESRGISTIAHNVFYGSDHAGSDSTSMIAIHDTRGMHHIQDNRLIAQQGQQGIVLDGVLYSTLTHNIFESSDPSGVAIRYRTSSLQKDTSKESSFHECSHNTIVQGFYEGIHIEGKDPQLHIAHNTFSSDTLVLGIVCDDYSGEGNISIVDNTLKASQSGVFVRDRESAQGDTHISHNRVLMNSGNPGIDIAITGKAHVDIENNQIQYAKNLIGEFAGISCQFHGLEKKENAVSILHNTLYMHSANEGIALKNSQGSALQALVQSNEVLHTPSNKGIIITQESFHTMHLKMLENKEVPTFTLHHQGEGDFAIEGTKTSMKEENNPKGNYIFRGQELHWSSSDSKEIVSESH
jgi:hypothetical protein